MSDRGPTNEETADMLQEIADLLQAQGGNAFRARAYAEAAERVRGAPESVAELAGSGGKPAIEKAFGLGAALAGLITDFVTTGRSPLLERLRAEVAPEVVIGQVPGIGQELAQRIVSSLGVRTLEELEQAAYDGRLAQVEGFGPERIQAVQLELAGMLSRYARRRRQELAAGGSTATSSQLERPSVATLLAVDSEYRAKAAAGQLRTIAPKRFNPTGEAWLPILEVDRDGWHFTVLYSNTARAHELGMTHDWVVIYYRRAGRESQATVITASSGALAGKRIVRGREPECRQYYATAAKA